MAVPVGEPNGGPPATPGELPAAHTGRAQLARLVLKRAALTATTLFILDGAAAEVVQAHHLVALRAPVVMLAVVCLTIMLPAPYALRDIAPVDERGDDDAPTG